MKIKAGVKLLGLVPQASIAMTIVNGVYLTHGKDLVVTSGVEGQHKRRSAHVSGRAFDGRVNYLSDTEAWKVWRACRRALGSEYDVVLEMKPYEKRHLHVEWDPKK